MDKLRSEIVAAGYELGHNQAEQVAKAIMTTDTFPKMYQVDLGGPRLFGVAKGAGMIHPDMATMLCFIMTDAQIDKELQDEVLKEAVNDSLNMISVDSDTSTNDMSVLLSNGQAGPVSETRLRRGMRQLCQKLAIDIVRDGEGAETLLTVHVVHAQTKEDARQVARTVVSSPLVKTAVHGADPNWGRVVAAVGRAGAQVEQDKLTVDMADLGGDEAIITVDLNLGQYEATAWGCDLTKGYIDINTEYN
jgi:glutamate N-acetyltransferase/amino-acid N-acetyltransferase